MIKKLTCTEPNLLLLEMHWMNGNCGDLSFDGPGFARPYKIKRLRDALGFIGSLVQLHAAIESGARQNGHLLMLNNNKVNEWRLQYQFLRGMVTLCLLFNAGSGSYAKHKVFEWVGCVRQFRGWMQHMLINLPSYPFSLKGGFVSRCG